MTVRHARQIRLVEVGEAGQERIGREMCVVPGTGLSAVVEARYLAGAGVERLVVDNDEVARAAHEVDPSVGVEVTSRPFSVLGPGAGPHDAKSSSDVTNALTRLSPGAREVALGAYRALVAIRSVIVRP